MAASILGARAQNTRDVAEPVIPPSFAMLAANLAAIDGNRTLANADKAKLDTVRIQQAIANRTPARTSSCRYRRGQE